MAILLRVMNCKVVTRKAKHEEVIENIKDAISLHVEDRIEVGEEVPQSQYVSLTLMDLAI